MGLTDLFPSDQLNHHLRHKEVESYTEARALSLSDFFPRSKCHNQSRSHVILAYETWPNVFFGELSDGDTITPLIGFEKIIKSTHE